MKYNWKRNIVVFLASQAISVFGSSLVQYAITWHITLSTKSGMYSMLAIVCGILPTFFLSPFAGVWADRYNRKRLIILADGGIAFFTLILAMLYMAGHTEIWLMLVVMAIRALGSAVQNPSISAMLPDIVPAEHLTRVNGIYGTLNSVIGLISPMVSGALLSMVPLHIIFFIDVVTAGLAILVVGLLLKLPEKKEAATEATAQSNYFTEFKLGISYIFKNRYLRNFYGYCMVFFFLSAPVAFLTPLQVARSYGDDVWRLTAIEVGFSVGMIIGGLVISAWGGFRNKVVTMTVTLFLMGAGTLALGIAMPFWLYLFFMGFVGLVMPIFNTPAMVLLQERVDPAYIGRVFGVMTMISSSVMPLGMLLFGPMADAIPIEVLLVVTGALLMLITLVLTRDKALRKAGEPIEAPPGGEAGV